MPAPAATEAAIKRALAAAKATGLAVTSFTVTRDGTVTVSTAQNVDSQPESSQARKPKQWAKR